eukprot:symbB.v1.2.021407.t1/scaffold1813.1/size100325/3
MGDAQEKIAVVARLRPTKPSSNVQHHNTEFVVQVPRGSETVNNQVEEYHFRFAKVFGPAATQREVFDRVAKDLVLGALDGVNCSIFAYGQTGSGKTYTICGDHKERGIIPRALHSLFEAIEGREDGVDYSVSLSFIEVYKEVGYDLLSKDFGRNQDSWPIVSVSLQSGEANPPLHVLDRLSMDRMDAVLRSEELETPENVELGVLLQQRGYCHISRCCDASGAMAQLEVENLWWSRQMQRTPVEMLDAYFGVASDWTLDVEPAEDDEEQPGLHGLDHELEKLGGLVSSAISSFASPPTERLAGLVHCCSLSREEAQFFDPPATLTDPSEAAPYLSHCTMKKVVLLYAFDKTGLVLRPRAALDDQIDVLLDAGHVLVYLHELLDVSVDFCCPAGSSSRWAAARTTLPAPQAQLGLLFQLDLIFEPCAPHKAKQEVLPVSTALLEQYKQLFLSIKDKAPEEMDLIALKDLHLDRDMGGISIAALHTALPTLPRVSARLGADMEAALLDAGEAILWCKVGSFGIL